MRTGRLNLNPSYGPGLTLLLADDPDHTYSSGGWVQIPRPRRAPGTDYQGPDDVEALGLTLAVDTRLMDVPMRQALVTLRKMKTAHSDRERPPTIVVTCPTIPLVAEGKWVMQSLAFGAPVVRDGELVRQNVQVGLEHFQAFADIDRVGPGRTRTNRGARMVRVIQSMPNDTLRAIAVRELGDVSGWKNLQVWNPRLRKLNPDEQIPTWTRINLGGAEPDVTATALGATLGALT